MRDLLFIFFIILANIAVYNLIKLDQKVQAAKKEIGKDNCNKIFEVEK